MYLNMWWIRLFIILLTNLIGDLNLSDVKIWKFNSTAKHGSHCHCLHWVGHSHHELNNKQTIHYDWATLKGIEDAVHHDNRLLPFGAVHVIWSLGLNAKPKSSRNRRTGFHQLRVNRSNLITVKKGCHHDPNIIIGTLNVQSLRSKELQVSDLIDDHALDILVLTETWLMNKEMDVTELNKYKNTMYTHNRTKGCSGGLALI